MDEPMLKHFKFSYGDAGSHIRERYNVFAQALCLDLMPGPERTVALRKLLESQDCALRAWGS